MTQGAAEPGANASVGDICSEEDRPKMIARAEFTYREVLDATKHQDDKVGRFLTAISFLTAGTVAVVLQSGG